LPSTLDDTIGNITSAASNMAKLVVIGYTAPLDTTPSNDFTFSFLLGDPNKQYLTHSTSVNDNITTLDGVISAAVDKANAEGGPQVVFVNYGADCNGHRFWGMASVDRRRIVTVRGSTICQSTIRAILAPTAQLFLVPVFAIVN